MPALEQFLGSPAGLSPTTVTRLTKQWTDDHTAFPTRDLSDSDYVYVWATQFTPGGSARSATGCGFEGAPAAGYLHLRSDRANVLFGVVVGAVAVNRNETSGCSCGLGRRFVSGLGDTGRMLLWMSSGFSEVALSGVVADPGGAAPAGRVGGQDSGGAS